MSETCPMCEASEKPPLHACVGGSLRGWATIGTTAPSPAAMLAQALGLLERVRVLMEGAGDMDRHVISAMAEVRGYIEEAKAQRETEAVIAIASTPKGGAVSRRQRKLQQALEHLQDLLDAGDYPGVENPESSNAFFAAHAALLGLAGCQRCRNPNGGRDHTCQRGKP